MPLSRLMSAPCREGLFHCFASSQSPQSVECFSYNQIDSLKRPQCVFAAQLRTMERWQNKIAVVTGASSGIGAAIAKDLAKAGMIVVGLARREGLVADLREELPDEAKERLHTLKCDVTKEADVIKAFSRIEGKFGGVDILVNNAGITRQTTLLEESNSEDVQAILNTNVLGVVYCTREAFKTMKERNTDGHVVILNSIAGHAVPMVKGISFNIYAPSKHALTAMTEIYRREFLEHATRIKITSICPGVVETEIVPMELREKYKFMPRLRPEDISNAVLYCIQSPPGVQIHEMIIKPIGEKF